MSAMEEPALLLGGVGAAVVTAVRATGITPVIGAGRGDGGDPRRHRRSGKGKGRRRGSDRNSGGSRKPTAV